MAAGFLLGHFQLAMLGWHDYKCELCSIQPGRKSINGEFRIILGELKKSQTIIAREHLSSGPKVSPEIMLLFLNLMKGSC